MGALIAVNACFSVMLPGRRELWAAAYEMAGEMGGLGLAAIDRELDLDLAVAGRLGGHTCIGVIATNAKLDKAQAWRVAMMAHDGLARAIRPVHTPFDGDTLFALSTARQPLAGPVPLALTRIGHIAGDCISRAVARAVLAAESLGGTPAFRTRRAGDPPGA